jgi:hypothetical protein
MMAVASGIARGAVRVTPSPTYIKHLRHHRVIFLPPLEGGTRAQVEEDIRNRGLFVLSPWRQCTIASPQPRFSGHMGVRWNWHLVLKSSRYRTFRTQSIHDEHTTFDQILLAPRATALFVVQ